MSVRPRVLRARRKTFSLVAVEPGKFDLENSFIDEAKQASLHVLARHKKPKAPPKKGHAAGRGRSPRRFHRRGDRGRQGCLWRRGPYALEVQGQ